MELHCNNRYSLFHTLAIVRIIIVHLRHLPLRLHVAANTQWGRVNKSTWCTLVHWLGRMKLCMHCVRSMWKWLFLKLGIQYQCIATDHIPASQTEPTEPSVSWFHYKFLSVESWNRISCNVQMNHEMWHSKKWMLKYVSWMYNKNDMVLLLATFHEKVFNQRRGKRWETNASISLHYV